jgi:hypothetical protein
MSQPDRREAFFIGWSNSIDPALGRYLALVGCVLLAMLGLAGLGLGRAVDDPAETLLRLGPRDANGGPARPGVWLGGQSFTGHVLNLGYPVLYVAGDPAFPNGRTLLLSGDGKAGPTLPKTPGAVTLTGGLLQRGSLEMLVLEADPKASDLATVQPPAPVQLGKWRAIGEICDGKCVTGAMLPGAGLAHKACANLCLTGDLPPVLVTKGAIAGSHYLLLTTVDGRSLRLDELRDLTAIPVELTGDVERVGNMLVFKTDLAKARRL